MLALLTLLLVCLGPVEGRVPDEPSPPYPGDDTGYGQPPPAYPGKQDRSSGHQQQDQFTNQYSGDQQKTHFNQEYAQDVYEVETTGYFEELGNSVGTAGAGFLLVFLGSVLLFWNEGRTLHSANALQKAAKEVVSVKTGGLGPEGALVHVSESAESQDTVNDPDFGVSAQAVKLKRTVQMYQWKETKTTKETKKMGGGKTKEHHWHYSKVWSSSPLDSQSYKNPPFPANPNFPISEHLSSATNVQFGEYWLSPSQISRLSAFEPLSLPSEAIRNAQDMYDRPARQEKDNTILFSEGGLNIGDVKVSFSVCVSQPKVLSVLARSATNEQGRPSFDGSGTVDLLSESRQTASDMLDTAASGNSCMGMACRIGGFLMITIGFNCISAPLVALTDFFPFLGNMLEFGIEVVSVIVSALLSILIIAIAWLYYRPLYAVMLLSVVFGALYLMRQGDASLQR